MGKNQRDREAEQFFDNLLEFVSDSTEQTKEELTAELKEEGIDTDRLVSNVKEIVNSRLEKSRLAWQKEGRDKKGVVLDKIVSQYSKTKDIVTSSRNEILERINSLISSYGQELSWEHRNLEKLSEDDLRQTLIDLERLASLKDDLE